jgi:adenosylmethionine---8-amino-7-oxononanoate aminotransferase
LELTTLQQIDNEHIWHPYSPMPAKLPALPVASAKGSEIQLADGRLLVDGMSSWWCTIFGYSHPQLVKALQVQAERLSHVMFGGLTHEPAAQLTQALLELLPASLSKVFLADTGSVAVEVALKMAVQYWQAKDQPERQRFITVKHGYHGDTTGAMSVCDPDTGMHRLFSALVKQHVFAESPRCINKADWQDDYDCSADIADLAQKIQANHRQLAGVIIEPIVQGAGGMRFHHPQFLRELRALCDRYELLLIFDEIATGFGRTGKCFAMEHANVVPDIITLGKALTGGMMTLAATICSEQISDTISNSKHPYFMHGPTFMGNPLACAVANANLQLFKQTNWQELVEAIEQQLIEGLTVCATFDAVADVRVLGAIGVIEFNEPINMQKVQPAIADLGVWLRPFGKLLYCMPAYTISTAQLNQLTRAMVTISEQIDKGSLA